MANRPAAKDKYKVEDIMYHNIMMLMERDIYGYTHQFLVTRIAKPNGLMSAIVT